MVSMDNYAMAHDEEIFPDSFSFMYVFRIIQHRLQADFLPLSRPDRWLGDPKAPDGKQLSRYMVAFGKSWSPGEECWSLKVVL